MAMVCEICGKGPSMGNRIVRHGLSKKQGGIGLHTTAVTRRRFLPNVQRVLCLFDGAIVTDCEPENLIRLAPEQVVSFLRTRFDFSTFGENHPALT